MRLIFVVPRLLARNAQPHTRHSPASRQRDRRVAFLTVVQTGAVAQLAPRAGDRIIDSGVDLVLDRAVSCPTGGHGYPPQVCRPIWGRYTPAKRKAFM